MLWPFGKTFLMKGHKIYFYGKIWKIIPKLSLLPLVFWITGASTVGSKWSRSVSSVCVYSNSRNDVPWVAQRYGTIAAYIRGRASVLVVFVVLCVHMHSFTGLIRRTPPPTFSDTAIADRHSDTTIFQLRAHWVRISWSIGSENWSDMCPWWESNPRLPACKASTLSTRPGSPLYLYPCSLRITYSNPL